MKGSFPSMHKPTEGQLLHKLQIALINLKERICHNLESCCIWDCVAAGYSEYPYKTMSSTKKLFNSIWTGPCFNGRHPDSVFHFLLDGQVYLHCYFRKPLSWWKECHGKHSSGKINLCHTINFVYHLPQHHWRPGTLFHGNSFSMLTVALSESLEVLQGLCLMK